MDPGTAAILTLSAITGISGYGAYKLNAKAKGEIDEQIKNAVAATKKLLTQTESERDKVVEEARRLTQEITDMKIITEQLETKNAALSKEKTALTQNLDSATELENTYRALSPEAFKQAITDFKDNPAIQKLEHPEFFEPLLSRFSMSRGTAQSLYTKFANAVAKEDMMSKADFDSLLLETLKGVDSSLAKVKAKAAAEAKTAKDKAAEEKAAKAAEAKQLKDNAAKAKADEEAAAKKKADEEKAFKDAQTLQDIVNAAFEEAEKGRPLTSNTLYQKVKKPFLDGVDSVARGVQKAVDVTKQAAVETGKVIRAPLTVLEKRRERYEEALKQQGGAGDTFDTDVNYRLFHPKDGDKPNKVLAYLFEKTSKDDTLAKNMLPVFDAFMYWRSTVLKYPLAYKPELVASAEMLFKLIVYTQISRVFRNVELEKAIEKKIIEMYQDPTQRNEALKEEMRKRDPEKLKRLEENEAKIEQKKQKAEAAKAKAEADKAKAAAKVVTNPMRKTTGGMRKKKLRTRRGVKQNVRRTRRSQNRPNRTDTYSSRRTEVDASGDELGLW